MGSYLHHPIQIFIDLRLMYCFFEKTTLTKKLRCDSWGLLMWYRTGILRF